MSQIAIDGPAGVGKSTAAVNVAKALGFTYVDTGAMYRAAALGCTRALVNLDDEEAVCECCRDALIDIRYVSGEQHIYLDGEDVTKDIRAEAIGTAASAVSKYPSVREGLVAVQRDIAKKHDVVMDGRDIGTKVLPDADLKIYLTASADVRSERRYEELRAKGGELCLEKVKRDIEERDYNDMNRKVSPLRAADDAVKIDTSNMSIEEVADAIVKLYGERHGSDSR